VSSDCIFCKIVSGNIPAEVVHRDDQTVAFVDVNPVAPTHLLVVPRRHIARLDQTDGNDRDLLGSLLATGVEVARARGLDGYRLVMNCGEEAGQSVFHLHLHVLGGRPLSWPPG